MPLILQIGDGVFLRAFAASMLESMNARLGFSARLVALKARPGSFSPLYARQGNRYTVVSRGLRSGKPVREVIPVRCLERLVDPFSAWAEALEAACDPELSVLISNTTEAGLVYREEPLPSGPGASWPGRITQLLRSRYEAFSGDPAKGLLLLPFELLEDNGRLLASFVHRHAKAWYADPLFESWLDGACCFAGTLVDRIVSGFDDGERLAVRAETGLDDGLLVVAEPYSFLAVEAPPEWEERFPARKAGLNVVWEGDISRCRTRKVYLLNGAHTLLAMTSVGLGKAFVREAMADPVAVSLVEAWYRAVLAVLPGSPEENRAYAREVTDRLANPGLDHRLESIALNSWAKFHSRLLPVIRASAEAGGPSSSVPAIGAFAFAALVDRYCSASPPQDDPAVLEAFKGLSRLHGEKAEELCEAVLTEASLWKDGIPSIPGLSGAAGCRLSSIWARGLFAAAAELSLVRAVRLAEGDSVAVVLSPVEAGIEVSIEEPGGVISSVTSREAIPVGHKIALESISSGAPVRKYGHPIGHSTSAIAQGSWVHTHNLASALSPAMAFPSGTGSSTSVPGKSAGVSAVSQPDYDWNPPSVDVLPKGFPGYLRADSQVGIRNEIWILPTVGCVNRTAENLAREARARLGLPVYAFTHPYGCSQLGGDLAATRNLLSSLARNPNAGAVLFLALGCENNRLEELIPALGPDAASSGRIRFLTIQESGDEMVEGLDILSDLADSVRRDRRVAVPLSSVRIGVKCGGSDGFSGLTANPLVGLVSDLICAAGGSVVFTEVPETFGAEDVCIGHAATAEVGTEVARAIEGFKAWFVAHGQGLAENPSPGNREGGITTLEEKSLGCVRKAGNGPITGVLPWAGRATRPGVTFVSAPGNDLVSSTALAAAGCQLILFTTGRGTPFGVPVPTLKISSNSDLARKKPHWIDYDAGELLAGKSYATAAGELMELIVRALGGEEVRNEISGHREIAILKDGVTL